MNIREAAAIVYSRPSEDFEAWFERNEDRLVDGFIEHYRNLFEAYCDDLYWDQKDGERP